jgi:hypothetical protein
MSILRRWFGPSKREIWRQVSEEVDGRLVLLKDVERLKLLFELFSETLDQLCRIGSAYEQAPDVTV